MNIHLEKKRIKKHLTLSLGGSKSQTNRLLLLQRIFPILQIDNLSDANDAILMRQGLYPLEEEINVGDAGTVMRFLTAYYACAQEQKVILTGSERRRLPSLTNRREKDTRRGTFY